MNGTDSRPSATLPRQERLGSEKAIARLFKEGRGGFVHPLRYVFLTGTTETGFPETGVAVLFAAPKKFHKRANKRNLCRRRLREAYRLNKSLLGGATGHLALVYSSKELVPYKELENAVCEILSKLGGV